MARVAEGLTEENLFASFIVVGSLIIEQNAYLLKNKLLLGFFSQHTKIFLILPHMTKKVNSLSPTNSSAQPVFLYPKNMRVGFFLRRHKRFSVSVLLNAEETWVHSNNSGSMLGLLRQGLPVLLSPANNPKRKLAYTQEAVWLPKVFAQGQNQNVETGNGFWVGVNTAVPNKILEAAFHAGLLEFAHGYTHFKREAKRGNSRLDACISGKDKIPLWVECKNVTLVEDDVALFPDAPTLRGQKHLLELMDIVHSGERAAMFYLVQRADGKCFAPAEIIDPAYAKLFWQALETGVEIYVMRARVECNGIYLDQYLPLQREKC